MATVLIPLPSRDFDPSEVAVSWKVLRGRGHTVSFVTPDGSAAVADPLMLSGVGLDLWGFIPGLRNIPLVGFFLRANGAARAAYTEMTLRPEFLQPGRWEDCAESAYDGLLLPGGHCARGMREYLESPVLQGLVDRFFEAGKPVAAICHGVLLAARSRAAGTGLSVLHGRKTTGLTWALERKAWMTARITRFWDPNYYRTYLEEPGQPAGYMSVQQEVERALALPADFLDVPRDAEHHARKTSGMARDSLQDATPAFVVRDGNYVSARWPGDVHTFAQTFAGVLEEAGARK
jgi:putative intracellular protease/amidase